MESRILPTERVIPGSSVWKTSRVELPPRATEELVAGWWEHARLAQGSREERKRLEAGEEALADAGWDGVHERVQRGGVEAVELVAALLRRAPDEDGVALVAAGPLEDLLHWHGDELVDQVARLAGQDPRFARALAGVWLSEGALTAQVTARLAPWLPTPGLADVANRKRHRSGRRSG